MKITDFEVGKEYRRVLSGMWTEPVGTIYKCDENDDGKPHLVSPSGSHTTIRTNHDHEEHRPDAFEPVEPELQFGDMVRVEDLVNYAYLGTTSEGRIITMGEPNKHADTGTIRAFIWNETMKIKKYVEPVEEKDTTVELTISEIADKIGINVKDLKIVD